MDIVVTVPKSFEFNGKVGLDAWISEGDAAGDENSGELYGFYIGGTRPDIKHGDRVYVVYNGRLRGYAPLIELEWYHARAGVLLRNGNAVAVTIDEYIRGFRGWRYRWWDTNLERPFPEWRVA